MDTQNLNFLGKGWSFPVKPAVSGRLRLVGEEEKIRQSIWIILSTAPGERVMRPDFGCGVHDLVFQANTAALRSQVQAKVNEALLRFEPRIDVTRVAVTSAPEQRNRLDIQIDYRVRANNAAHNLVYPFMLEEGVA